GGSRRARAAHPGPRRERALCAVLPLQRIERSETMTTTATSPVLRMRGIGQTFPGLRALSDVELGVRAGEVHAIVGENGAGKSTLMQILAGVYQPDEGAIELSGERTRITGQIDALRRGIGMVYQELNLVPDLTVAENIGLGHTPSRLGVVDNRALLAEAQRVLDALDTRIAPQQLVGSLTVSQQPIVA